VWVGEARRDVDLSEEAFPPQPGCYIPLQDLDGHPTIGVSLTCHVNARHTRPGDLTFDLVALGQSRLEFVKFFRHGGLLKTT